MRTTFFIALLSQNAWAYLDPGTGAILWQVLVAIGVGLSTFLPRIKNKFFPPKNS